MLSRDDDCIYSYWRSVYIAKCHLGFRIRAQPWKLSVLSDFCLTFHDTMRIVDGSGHESISLSACITEHETLIPCSLIEIDPLPFIDSLGDIRRLLIIADHDGESVAIIAEIRGVVSDISDGLASYTDIVDIGCSRDLTCEDAESSIDECFCCYASSRVFGEDRIEDRIRDLICDFIWVTF
jgi:hypothetical protein